MTLRSNDLLSLDTNVLVHWIRQNDTGIQLRDTFGLHERADPCRRDCGHIAWQLRNRAGACIETRQHGAAGADRRGR